MNPYRYRVQLDGTTAEPPAPLDTYADAMAYALTLTPRDDITHEVHVSRRLDAEGRRWYCESHQLPGHGWDFMEAHAVERMALA